MSLFPAFWSGIKYGFNPLAMTTILGFILFLSFFGKTRKRVIIFGLFFSAAVMVATFFLALGFSDKFFSIPVFYTSVRRFYLMVSGIFIIFGFVYLMDWVRYQKNKETSGFFLKEAVFLNGPKYIKEKFTTVFFLVLLSGFFGFILTLLSSFWPQDEYLFALFSFFMSGNDWKFVMSSFAMYSMAFVLPLIIVWVGIIWILSSSRIRMALTKAVSQRKIIASAVFLSMGFGLGYILLKVLI